MRTTYTVIKLYKERGSEVAYEYDDIVKIMDSLKKDNAELLERHTVDKKREGIARYKWIFKLPDGEDKCGKYESYGILKYNWLENIEEE